MKRIEAEGALDIYRNSGMLSPVDTKKANDVTKRLTAIDGSKVEVTYSAKDHRASAYVLDISGDRRVAVKPEDMPRALREIRDPMVFRVLLQIEKS
jgi:hypothetical protein